MTLNITLFVQAMNFLVVYVLMKRLLIDPYLHTKHIDEQEQHILDNVYAQESTYLIQTQHKKQKEWTEALNTLAVHIPSKVITQPLCVPTIQTTDVRLDAEQLDHAAAFISTILLNKGV